MRRTRHRGGRPLRLIAALVVVAGLLACDTANGGRSGGTEGAGNRPVRAAEGGGREAGAAGGTAAATDSPATAGTASGQEKTRLTVGGHEVLVEVADEPEERQRGLMYRESLPEDEGMLFVYDRERPLSFWMKNTVIPLDIAFLDASGRIVDIQSMEPYNEASITSRAPAIYALEMNRGWFEAHGVEVGDRVEF